MFWRSPGAFPRMLSPPPSGDLTAAGVGLSRYRYKVPEQRRREPQGPLQRPFSLALHETAQNKQRASPHPAGLPSLTRKKQAPPVNDIFLPFIYLIFRTCLFNLFRRKKPSIPLTLNCRFPLKKWILSKHALNAWQIKVNSAKQRNITRV